MYTDAVIPSNEAARITTISEDIKFAVVAGCADVIWAHDTTISVRNSQPAIAGEASDYGWLQSIVSHSMTSHPASAKSGKVPENLRKLGINETSIL